MSKEITYQNAIEELEQIVQEIENSEITVDELSTKVKRATKLISICNKNSQKLKKIFRDAKRGEERYRGRIEEIFHFNLNKIQYELHYRNKSILTQARQRHIPPLIPPWLRLIGILVSE